MDDTLRGLAGPVDEVEGRALIGATGAAGAGLNRFLEFLKIFLCWLDSMLVGL